MSESAATFYEQLTALERADTAFVLVTLVESLGSTPQETGAKMISFTETLRGMSREQLLILCLLDGYRANGPYHDFIRFYHRLAAYFSDYLIPMHVITEDVARKNNRPEFIERWLRAENEVSRAGIPVRVLDDRDGTVGRAVVLTSSPRIVVVNSEGIVVHEGELDEVQWWNLLATTLPHGAPAG